MDPISQGVLGATAALLVSKNKSLSHALIAGGIGGLVADADIVIKSNQDPLIALEFHRQFTHALLFIPIGGLIVACLLWITFFKKKPFKQTLLFSTMGYATHALLDACTTYGTQLLWPFSNQRVAFDSIAIIDPLVTIPLLFTVFLTYKKQSKKWIYAGTLFFTVYMSFGFVQKQRALEAVNQIAMQQSHIITRIKVMPTVGNLFVWRTLYESNQRYFVNSLKIRLLGNIETYKGASVAKLNVQTNFPELKESSVQYQDLQRFKWFSDGWLIIDSQQDNVISDARYSSKLNAFDTLWGIELDVKKQNKHVGYVMNMRGELDDFIPFNYLFDNTDKE